MIYRFPVGRLDCAVVSDGQMEPPWEPPLSAFFTPGSGVPGQDLSDALAAEGDERTTLACGYNCLHGDVYAWSPIQASTHPARAE